MPGIRTTPVVRLLLILSISAFVMQLIADTFFGAHMLEVFALVPQKVFEHLQIWQLGTYMFMHADLFHILFNMLILWMIGSELEAQWGSAFFTRYFFVCGISAGLFYLAVQSFFRGTASNFIPMLGSSGAVYGLLVAYGILYSERVLLFMMVFPMKAKYFVLVLAGVEFISTVFYSKSGIANAAHLGGMVVGFLYLFINAWMRIRKKTKNSGLKARFRPRHLRLVVNNEVLREFDEDEEDKPTFH